ncbi:MAG: hypothetical protein KKB50_12900 [Planctomycetes bacterium]|nr:hypothetical protein [Planctomycetota bacterium]
MEAGEREQGDERTLRVGGWISCQSARAMAGKLRLDGRKIGKLCDLLDVKIRDCELGCFE